MIDLHAFSIGAARLLIGVGLVVVAFLVTVYLADPFLPADVKTIVYPIVRYIFRLLAGPLMFLAVGLPVLWRLSPDRGRHVSE